MNLWLRLLLRSLTLSFRAPVPPLGPCLTRFRVLPLDLEPLGHVNNGRYLTWLDLARVGPNSGPISRERGFLIAAGRFPGRIR